MTETGRAQGDGGKPRTYRGKPSLAETHPGLAAEWDVEANGALTPEHLTAGSARKVVWRCALGHHWAAVINNRAHGGGCPVCSGRAVLVGFNDLATVRPELAAQWDLAENGRFGPTQVTEYSNHRAPWRCDRGHRWIATVCNRAKGGGCPFCANRKVLPGFNDLASRRPELAAEWDTIANRDLAPSQVGPGSERRVGWRCELGHSWFAQVANRARGQGCPYCAGQAVLAGFNDLASLRPELAAEWDTIANRDLAPSQVGPGSERRVGWRCELGHSWFAPVVKRTRGAGCPFCVDVRASRIETAAADQLKGSFEGVEQGVRLSLRWSGRRAVTTIDIALTRRNRQVAVEYDGSYWHAGAVKSAKDEAKTEALLDAGWIVIRIRENDLPHLDIVHPDLFQITHRYRQGTDEQLREQLEPVMAEIVRWLDERVPEAGVA